jgi:hypothetical protein
VPPAASGALAWVAVAAVTGQTWGAAEARFEGPFAEMAFKVPLMAALVREVIGQLGPRESKTPY